MPLCYSVNYAISPWHYVIALTMLSPHGIMLYHLLCYPLMALGCIINYRMLSLIALGYSTNYAIPSWYYIIA